MAGHLYRGTAFWDAVFKKLRQQYYGGLGEGGEFQQILGSLTEAQMPFLQEQMDKYWGRLGAEGQAVPGQGVSTAGQIGFGDILSDFSAKIATEALGAYQMPWAAQMGGAPTATSRSQLEATKAGQQSNVMGNMLGGCLFIFTEANNGVLDRIARRYRDEHGTLKQMVGYRLLANVLIPYMRKYSIVKWIIRWIMVKPMIWWGKAFYGENYSGRIFWPFKYFWLKIFELIGNVFINDIKGELKKCLVS